MADLWKEKVIHGETVYPPKLLRSLLKKVIHGETVYPPHGETVYPSYS